MTDTPKPKKAKASDSQGHQKTGGHGSDAPHQQAKKQSHASGQKASHEVYGSRDGKTKSQEKSKGFWERTKEAVAAKKVDHPEKLSPQERSRTGVKEHK